MRECLLFTLFGLFAVCASAQKTTIINHYEGEEEGAAERQYVLRTTERHTVVINYYEVALEGDEGRMQALISDALDFYIDRSVLFEGDQILLRNKPAQMKKDLEAIVRDAIRYYHFREAIPFDGFSEELSSALTEMDGKRLPSEWNPEFQGGPIMDKRFTFLEQEVNNLKALLREEVGFFTEGNLYVQVDSREKELQEEQMAMLEEVQNFRTNDSLATLEIAFSNETLNLLASDDDFILPTFTSRDAKEALDPDLADRILDMLAENALRMDVLTARVEEREDASTAELRQEVSELKALVRSLMQELQGGNAAPTYASLPPKFDGFAVYFTSGATYLNTEAKLQLNELIDLLAAQPQMKVMLTGFADPVGNPEMNLRLSKARAESVRYHLSRSGIPAHRMLVNYFGEAKANGTQQDRKVEVKVLPG